MELQRAIVRKRIDSEIFISDGPVVESISGVDLSFVDPSRQDILTSLSMSRDKAKLVMRSLGVIVRGQLTGEFCIESQVIADVELYTLHPVVNVDQILLVDKRSGAIEGSSVTVFAKSR